MHPTVSGTIIAGMSTQDLPITDVDLAPCLVNQGFLLIREGLMALGLWDGSTEVTTAVERAEMLVSGILPECDDQSGPF